MKAFRLLLAACALSTALLSCSTTKALAPDGGSVYMTDTKKIRLLPPSCMDGSYEALQLFSGSFGSRQFASQTYLECTEERVFAMLINEFGIGIGTLSYQGESVTFESDYFPKDLQAAYIVADLQNVYYKVSELEKNYAAAGLTFLCEKSPDGTETRLIQDGGTVIEKITILPARKEISIQNVLRGYSYHLEELEE
ncbi:MAG: DUF3261 domain-containing protein [Treponema sp.]|nr:DUF3261 domain-containing protein [Treponema sp.]